MFTRDILKALLIVAGKDDHRISINGIYVEPTPTGAIAVATDGHRLLAVHLQAQDIPAPRGFLTRGDAERMAKVAGPRETTIPDATGFTLGGYHATLDPGITYPDWRRATPAEVNNQPGHYDPALVGDFGKVAKLLGARFVLAQNGEKDAAIAQFQGADAIGVLMPISYSGAGPLLPAWVHPAPAAELKAA